jgi:hypothetical protein
MLTILIFLLAFAGCAPDLTDDQIVKAAAAPFDKKEKMGRHEVLGQVGKVNVVADYYCSDVCPAYAMRVVHFDASPRTECDKAGGVVKTYIIPKGIAAVPQAFCVPKVLAEKNL